MYVEAFTAAKDPDHKDANEDRLVILPGRAYAVIDGVTDKSGRRYDGLTGGQLAGQLIEHALQLLTSGSSLESIDKGTLIAAINDQIASKYQELGIQYLIEEDPNSRFSAQLVLAIQIADVFRFFLIGDCGLRIDARETYWTKSLAEEIATHVRVHLHNFLAKKGIDDFHKAAVARCYTVQGLATFDSHMQPWLTPSEWQEIKRDLLGCLPAHFPQLDSALVRDLVLTGIRGQGKYRNVNSPLAMVAIDGLPIPAHMIKSFERPIETITSLELFSDGYFGYPDRANIAHWEKRFARIELEDPAKVKTFPSTKGSGQDKFADDRTVLIIRKTYPAHV